MTIIAPGSVIGIMGGGQLGRMLAIAAAYMGYRTHIFTPDEDSPASQVAWKTTVADYGDEPALRAFAAAVDVVTFEFENIPSESLELLAAQTLVRPDPSILKTCRNRSREKEMIRAQGIQTAPFVTVRSLDDLRQAVEKIGFPCVLKTAEMGYDGKGQVKLHAATECETAWQSLNTAEAVLEGWITFDREISVVVARDSNGHTSCYEPSHNIHKNHILDKTLVPAGISDTVMRNAQAMAIRLADALGLVGILAVEMFLQENGELIVNELAPRPHNSGHWTIEAAKTSQFEQQIRAICGHYLGDSSTLYPSEMINLIGEDVEKWAEYAINSQAHLHLYGKKEARKGRKMGHITLLKP